jgi:hypothetical protein
MNQRALRIAGTLKHTNDEQTDAALQEKAREHADRHPGVRFLADVLRALHVPGALMRNAKGFYSAFTPRDVMDAFAQRPDLRVRMVKAITGGAPTLLRRLSPEALASQIDLLVIEDLSEAERSVRAEADRALTVQDLYLKYLDPVDLAMYLPPQSIWTYESRDSWWKLEPTATTRALMATELRGIRRHGILTDAEILDLLRRGDAGETPVAGRKDGPAKGRAPGRCGRQAVHRRGSVRGPAAGGRDLIAEMVDSVPMAQLREVVAQAVRILGVSAPDDNDEPTAVTFGNSAKDAAAIPTPIGQRLGPKPTPAVTPPPSLLMGKPRAANDRTPTVPPKPIPIPPAPPAKAGRPRRSLPMPRPARTGRRLCVSRGGFRARRLTGSARATRCE